MPTPRPGEMPSKKATCCKPAHSSGSAVRPSGPEWTTQRWKLQVEAEARGRLKKRLRDIGSEH